MRRNVLVLSVVPLVHACYHSDNLDTSTHPPDTAVDIIGIDHAIPDEPVTPDVTHPDPTTDSRDESTSRCPEDMIYIPGTHFCIDSYEASRPDASHITTGLESGPARSVEAVLPWNYVTWSEAIDACSEAGKELCSTLVWHQACSHGGELAYPYGNSFDEERCIGRYFGYGGPQPTGSADCEGGYPGVFDMSGNVAEWTSDCLGGECSVNIGSYVGDASSLRCDAFIENSHLLSMWDIGFRCCSSID